MKYSPSQVKTYRGCQRAYGFAYNDKIRSPSSPKQQFGTDVHTQLEKWLSKGKVPENTPEGKVAKQGLQWLPSPSPDLLIEHNFVFPWADNIDMGGFVDCASPPTNTESPLVIDHKTTSALRWAMSTDQLESDPQAIIYAVFAMLKWEAPIVRARWVYYAASNPKKSARKPTGSIPVEVVFNTQDAMFQSRVAQISDDLVAMQKIRIEKPASLSLPWNPGSCEMYGGCFHKERCDLSPEDKFEAFLTLEEIKK